VQRIVGKTPTIENRMAADKLEGKNSFEAVLKAPTSLLSFVRTAFDSANGGDSGAAIKSMMNTAASEGTVSKFLDGNNPPSLQA
jgi:hypothetical protein